MWYEPKTADLAGGFFKRTQATLGDGRTSATAYSSDNDELAADA